MSLSIQLTGVTVRHGDLVAVDDVTATLPAGGFTAVLGPNGCGKSTLLRTVAGILAPQAGTVRIGERALAAHPRRELARTVGLLPQQPPVPPGLTVADLVRRGRHPHRSWLRAAGPGDEAAVERAMTQAHVHDLADRPLTDLSGGQRQRAWLALVLAQETPVVLLDEPTTFLDLAHQYALLDLCAELQESGRTLVAVLHDLSQAAAYADHVVLLRAGRLVAEGPAREVLTPEALARTYDIACHVDLDAPHGGPVIVPLPRG
ncbi:ABC transporter ATP-binding protein [Arsenicicoccus dermatophilus]|uniref:ABC transporter ATP-binding protein n=1 Tax=Arsenicicoccus dermatophilus TaxID=1076331 RepID=UPI001F4CE183|nr:ABC transporter ATP-binding protein [Arsenicicoccus dermatophilus]MCH8614326.1 ABC transporter ATP-binding protein [Arsenicicoccus dermatophilus]